MLTFNVVVAAIETTMMVIERARKGEITQLEIIFATSSQLMPLAPVPTSPAPTMAQITVCVPLMGIAKNVDDMMKVNVVIETASIMRF